VYPIWKNHTNVCIAILFETQDKMSCCKFDTTQTYLQAQQRSLSLSFSHMHTHTHNHCSTCTFIPPQTCNFSVWVSPQTVILTTAQHWCFSPMLKKSGVITAMKVQKVQFFLSEGMEQHLGLQWPLFFEKFVLQLTTTHHVTQHLPYWHIQYSILLRVTHSHQSNDFVTQKQRFMEMNIAFIN